MRRVGNGILVILSLCLNISMFICENSSISILWPVLFFFLCCTQKNFFNLFFLGNIVL